MGDDLKKEIESGKKLDKLKADELKKREEEKKKRADELKKLQAKLKASGQWKEE
jgi:hypothetical protein